MSLENLKKILILKSVKGIGNRKGREIIEKGLWNKIPLDDPRSNDLAQAEIEKIQKKKISFVTLLDSHYPPLLREIYDPPLLLYYRGKLEASLPVAMVGTRNPSRYGAKAARAFAQELCHGGISVVSGFAPGIDSIAHQAVVDLNGPTLAVLGCGLDFNYPAENTRLKEEVIENGGALISEFSLGTAPAAHHFPMRNRIISGLSLSLLVIEGKLSSGALITAKLAAEQGRPVYALPGSVFEESFFGNHTLLREGAILARSAGDILADLGKKPNSDSSETPSRAPEKKREFLLTEEEKLIFELLEERTPLELLMAKTGMAPSRLLSLLTQLSLKGAVEEQGGLYSKA